ncbi:hypothetical protein Anapl_03085 [Anas platyrhynchos]|uniref:Uncharacterized protein n=1 Tax=Anas platyrhynchos TaxID=8839 RepID=R0LWS1_ANAPL|nr:hypothetical protein Anapl_03085 [Anas platyrhynchos]
MTTHQYGGRHCHPSLLCGKGEAVERGRALRTLTALAAGEEQCSSLCRVWLEKTCQGVGDLGTCLEKVASVGLLLQVQKCLLASEGTRAPSIHMVESTDESQCRDIETLGKPQNRGSHVRKNPAMGHPAVGDIATHMAQGKCSVYFDSSRKDLPGGWDKAKPQKRGSPKYSSPEPAAAPEYLRGQSPALSVPCCAVLCRATPCRAAVHSTAEPRQLETYSSPAVGEPNASLPCLPGTGNLGHLKIKYGYMRCQDNQLPDLVSSWLGRAPQAQGEHSKPETGVTGEHMRERDANDSDANDSTSLV